MACQMGMHPFCHLARRPGRVPLIDGRFRCPSASCKNAGEYFADLTADIIVRTSGVSNHIISYFPLLVQCHL